MLSSVHVASALSTMMAAASMDNLLFLVPKSPSLSSSLHSVLSDCSSATTFSTTFRMQLSRQVIRYDVACNDSTSPAMDQSVLEPSSLVQVQSKKFLDRDRTNPQFFWTWTELALIALDQSTRAESA